MSSTGDAPDGAGKGSDEMNGAARHDALANESGHPCGRWHKYVKPRVGQMFQVDKKVLRSLSVQSSDETDSEKSSSAGACVASTERAQSAVGRRGRPARGREAAVRLNETLGVKAAHRVAAAASEHIVPERGGLCVHRPPTDGACGEKDDFLEFSRNIIMQTPAWTSPEALSSLERRWKDEVADKFGGPAYRRSGSNISSGSGRKRGRKRKAAESDDDASGIAASSSEKEDDESSKLSSTEVVSRGVPVAVCVAQKSTQRSLEEDELMLSYLQSIHKGNCDVAKFSMISDLSMGRAVQARRHLKKRRKEEEMEAPLSDMLYPSESWRRRYERLCSAMRGDVKNRPGLAKYSYVTGEEPQCRKGSTLDTIQFVSSQEDVDDRMLSSVDGLKQTWRSVLECAEDIVDRTSGGAKSKSKPSLKELLTLMGKAHTLMRPEEIFGKRDTSVKRISQCMNVIVDRVVTARNHLAKLFDIVYDEKDEGVELDVLEKYIDNIEAKSPVVIEETEILRKMVSEASQWEKRLDHVLRPDHSDSSSLSESFDRNNILAAVEQLALDAQVLSLRPRSLVLLEARIEKARVLRNRIREMRQSESREGSENKKLIAALVREANKLDLVFPELTMLTEVHEAAQEWTDRAAIAVRSRISLSELEDLVDRGDTMPVNLSDLLVKLRSRVSQAKGWIARLREKLGGTDDGNEHERKLDETKWLEMIRKVLLGDDDRAAEIQDLAVEGSRIPVDIPELHLLQVEVDARNWSMKARKLLEKKAKIDDLREHLTRGETIRDKVPLDTDLKSAWTLGCEKDLLRVVESSDAWYRKYRPYLEGDNRRADGRSRISITLLRQIVLEGNSINANLGNASVKMNRILSQAESWFNDHKGLLASFKIMVDEDSKSQPPAFTKDAGVKMDAVNVALEKASELSVDLEEAMQLKALAEKSQEWFTRALAIAPKRSKRNARGKKKVNRDRHSLDELLSLVQEAAQLPIDISEDLDRLQMQLTEVQSWRLQAQCEIKSIVAAFDKLHSERLAYYGEPSSHMDKPDQKGVTPASIDSNSQSPPKSSSKASEGLKVHRMIGSLVKSVQSVSIYTTEEGIAEMLGRVSKWCTRAAVIIATPGHIFEKRYFKDLDSLIAEGEVLLREGNSDDLGAAQLDDASLMKELKTSWVRLVSDDKTRLEKCRERRDEFISWCETAESILSATDKKIPIETLRDLGEQSLVYPKGAETVKRVQTLLQEANEWIQSTSDIVNSGQKISLEDAKGRVSKGEGLNISCPEFRNLRNALRVSRGWQLRVKRSKLDSGQSQISDIKDLIEEHKGFLVCMPDEIKKLKEALQGYCLCRKPYEGFMVGCDACEEWFHGPCIGVSESQAERYDKYVCVRCVISKLFKGCAEATVQAIRKWTNSKDLSKARQIDGQRHQRKVREKRREIEKLKTEIEALKSDLNSKNGNTVLPRNIDLGKDSPPQDGTIIAEEVNSVAPARHNGIGQLPFGEAVQSSNSPMEGQNGLENQTEMGCGISDAPISSAGGPIDGSKEREASLESDIKSNDVTDETREKLSKATATLENCHRRMDQLSDILNERKSREAREDTMSESLRQWFVLVRASVLVPNSTEKSKLSRPQRDGSLSTPMDQAVLEATKLGIRHLPDVSLVINAFGCMAWSLRALHVLSRKPKIEEIRSLVSQSEDVSFKLPETKCVRMLQSPLSRATLWQAKVIKALKPIPGEKKPYELEMLSSLLQGARDIPYTMPEESQLWNTIEDDGNRHCLCGGPSDGSFMISCDKCEVWYHGACVELNKTQSDAQSKWICPPCTGAVSKKTWQIQARNKNQPETRAPANDAKDADHSYEEDISQYAPDVNELWPPFGLLQNSTALTALGVSDPSDCDDIDTLTLVGANASDSSTHQQKQLAKMKTSASSVLNGCTSTLRTSGKQQGKQSETATAMVLGSGIAQSLPPSQQPIKGRDTNSRAGGVLADTNSELSRAVQRAMQERERMSRSVERGGQLHAQLIAQQREMLPRTTPPPGSGPPRQSLAQGRQTIPQATQTPRSVNSQSLTQRRQNPAQTIQSNSNTTSQQLAQGRPILSQATQAPRNIPSQRSLAQGRQMLSQAAKTPGSGPSQPSFGRQMLPQAAQNPGSRPSQQSFAQGRHMLPQAAQNPGSRPLQQPLAQVRQRVPQTAQNPGSRPSQQSLAPGKQRLLQAAQNHGSRPSQQSLAQGRQMLPQTAQSPGSGPSEQPIAQGRHMLLQAAQTPRSGPSQQSLAQGRQGLPQVAQTPGSGLSQQSLQLLLSGGLPRTTGGRNETVQVTQAMQLMAQTLKNPASDAVQASQAMQMLAQAQEVLPKGAEVASNCSSRATHTMQTPFHGREGISQQANNARVAGGSYQTQQAQLIQGVERRSCQVTAAGIRAAVQPPSAMQLIQNVSPRNSFFQQNSSPALVPSAVSDGGSEKRSDIRVQSANNLSIQPNASAPTLPATSQRQERFGGLNASSMPVEGRRSETQSQLLPSSAIIPNNYNMENRQR